MFIEFFDWFCSCISSVFEVMKTFTLFEGFTYFNLVMALLAIPIIFKLISFMIGIEDEEVHYGYTPTGKYAAAYDMKPSYKLVDRGSYKHSFYYQYDSSYKGRHHSSTRGEYEPRHQPKGGHGK